jgi:hypothetical protein
VIVYTTLIIPNNILFEAALSFLGVGISPTTPSWGRMIAEAASGAAIHRSLVDADVPGYGPRPDHPVFQPGGRRAARRARSKDGWLNIRRDKVHGTRARL